MREEVRVPCVQGVEGVVDAGRWEKVGLQGCVRRGRCGKEGAHGLHATWVVFRKNPRHPWVVVGVKMGDEVKSFPEMWNSDLQIQKKREEVSWSPHHSRGEGVFCYHHHHGVQEEVLGRESFQGREAVSRHFHLPQRGCFLPEGSCAPFLRAVEAVSRHFLSLGDYDLKEGSCVQSQTVAEVVSRHFLRLSPGDCA